jgi:predicted amidophosphoribosyltransferase
VRLKICARCKRPFLANKEFCPHCPVPYNPESWANVGCLLAMVLPIFMIVFLWMFFFFGVFFR